MTGIISYNEKLKERAKEMRNNSTKAEIVLWNGLKQKQLGVRFVRQKMISNYIIDFYCKELQVAIEVDDQGHDVSFKYDEKRTEHLTRLGIEVLRFSNKDVLENPDGVLANLKEYIAKQYNM